MRDRRITIVEVARRAGVSTATAGRVLGGYGYAGKAAREAVLAAAQALGYRPNQLARGLITGKTRTIGVIAGDISSPFHAAVLRGISNVVEAHDFGLLITNSDETAAREVAAAKLLSEKQVDGIVVSPCDPREADHLHEMARQGTKIVLLDRLIEGFDVDCVAVENVESARAGVARLLAAGHRRIGIVAELGEAGGTDLERFLAAATQAPRERWSGLYPSWQRLLGYLLAYEDVDVDVESHLVCRAGTYAAAAAETAVAAVLARPGRPTALFPTDGLMSAGTMSAIGAAGLDVPGDVSVLAFDDLDWMTFAWGGIDAIAQPRRKLGETAARLLLDRIEGATGPAKTLRLEPQCVRRGSVRAIG